MNITWVIDSATREHHLVRSTGFLIPVKVDETGWIPWKGDNQFSPVPCGTKVEIKYYDEDTELTEYPEMKDWSRGIIAYRPFNEWHGQTQRTERAAFAVVEDSVMDVKKLEMTADKSRYFVDRDVLEALLDRLEAAEQERDALAAHMEVLASIINSSDLTDRPHVMSALNSLPATSLTRQKLLWQAEAVETAVARGYRSRDELAGWAEHLRRQAEEKMK